MEHSILHGLELTGLITALGGVLLVLGVMRPAIRALGSDSARDELTHALTTNANRWVFRGALVAALVTFIDLFVDVAEVQGNTIFSGVSLGTVVTFATQTRVGHLALARMATLVLTACVVRIPGTRKWWLTGVVAFSAVILTSLVSHAAARPAGRLTMIAAQITHIATASAWMGVLIHLLTSRSCLQGRAGQAGFSLLAEMVRRFSPIALAMTSLLALSGLFMAVRFLEETGALLTSAYGLTLIVKLLLLVPALIAGCINFRIIRPELLANAPLSGASTASRASEQYATAYINPVPSGVAEKMAEPLDRVNVSAGGSMKGELLRRFGRMLELEVTSGLLVIVAAGILASVSPPGGGGAYSITARQAKAMLSPHLPATAIANPAKFYGAAIRTLDDLRYSEFSHNWSGVMVCLLGLCWLIQAMGGKWAGIAWPLLLIPFAVFLTMISDPEVWWLHQISLRDFLGNPQLVEHELGKMLLLGLTWLGWRDHKNKSGSTRPLGYALPAIMLLGGFMLLGHAHSALNATEELTNLINEQHAIFGGFLILAGAVRWLTLRDLFPPRIAKILWPGCIIGLGLFMAFFYREVV